MEKLVYTRIEAAEALGVSLGTLDYMLKAGQLKSIRISKRLLIIPRAEIDSLLSKAGTKAEILAATTAI
jgi:excisionase family DNA binding protein